MGLGALLVTLNLKNFPISISAAAVLTHHHSVPNGFLCGLLLFTMVSSIGIIAPVIVAGLGGEKADQVLQNWKRWLGTNNSIILCGLFLIIGITSLTKGAATFF